MDASRGGIVGWIKEGMLDVRGETEGERDGVELDEAADIAGEGGDRGGGMAPSGLGVVPSF